MKLKCLVQVKSKIFGKSVTVIPVFNTSGLKQYAIEITDLRRFSCFDYISS